MNNKFDKSLLESELKLIEHHLNSAFELAKKLQVQIQNVEGESDLFRKFASYLTPNLNHWINSLQAGNIRDLKEYLKKLDKND